jgi:hypothetical protein
MGKIQPNFGYKMNMKVWFLKHASFNILATYLYHELWWFFLNFGWILAIESLKNTLDFRI